MDDPLIAVAVVVEHAGSGSRTAAPMARKLLDYYLMERVGILDDETDPDNEQQETSEELAVNRSLSNQAGVERL